MPDFDRNLQSTIKDTKLPIVDVKVKAPQRVSPVTFTGPGGDGSKPSTVFDLLNDASKTSYFGPKGIFVTNEALDDNIRYSTFNPTVENIEDYKAYGQSTLDRAFNGITKGVSLAGTTILGLGGLAYGSIKAALPGGKFSDIYNNEITRELDDFNTKLDREVLPNYYSQKETEAAWYSTDNWFNANFLFDKLIKNSGYAVGAIFSGNIINAGLKATGLLLGTRALRLATAAESSQAFKVFTPLLRNTARAFSLGKNIEAANILEKGVSSIADVEAQSAALAEIARTTNVFGKINDIGRRSIVASLSTAGEASMEALQTSKEFRENLIQEYKVNHNGLDPIGADLENINRLTASVGNTSFLGNLAILGITEYVQLPKLLGSSYAAEKKAANSLIGETGEIIKREGKYIAAGPTTKFGKLFEKTSRVGGFIFDPKESAQELSQYALQVGTQNYYKKGYESKDANLWTDLVMYGFTGTDETGKDVGALVSKEGMESMLLGGITGGLLQISSKIRAGNAIKANTQNYLNQIENAPTFKQAFKERLDSANRGIVLQQQQQDAIIQGDKLEAKDLDADMMHNYIAPRIKYGRFDMVIEDIADLKRQASTEEGLAALKQEGFANTEDTIQSYQQRLSNFETVAKNTNEIYKSHDLRFSGEILKDSEGKPVLDAQGRQLRKYSSEVIDKMVYAASKVADYDLRIPQVNLKLAEAGVNTQDVLNSIIEQGKPNKTATATALNDINDLNVLDSIKDELKSNLSDVIELSLRRQMFLEEHNDIKENPLNYEVLPGYEFGKDPQDMAPVDVKQTEKTEEGKKEEVDKKLSIGKEYSLKEPLIKEGSRLTLAPKLTVMSQTLGGELEVRLPNGKTTFMSPEEFKKYNISDENNTSQEMADILDESIDTVLNQDKHNDAKKEFLEVVKEAGNNVVDKVGWVNSLDNQSLIDDIEKEFNNQTEELIKRKEEEERLMKQLAKDKEILEKEQDDIESTNGGVATGNPETETTNEEKEGSLQDSKAFFISGTTESEKYNDPLKSKPHIKRSREFLNNIKNFPNRKNIRVILVSPKQQEALGMKGLAQMSYGKDIDSPLSDIPGITDAQQGLIAQVFVLQEGGKVFFIDKNGNKLTEVGGRDAAGNLINVDLNEVIFQTMPRAKNENGEIITKDSSGRDKFRKGQEEEFKAYAEAWAKYREQLFNLPEGKYPIFEFTVSRGIPKKNVVNGENEKNHVGDILVPSNKIASTRGLIVIPTTGTIAHNGQLLKFTNGRPVLQFGDTLEFLNNKKFSEKQANAIFQVIKALSEGYIKNRVLERKYTTFLKNVLFYSKNKGAENRFYINPNTSEILIGNKPFLITKIAENEKEIVDTLKNVFNNINNEGLTKNFDNKFVEYYIDENDNLAEREWKNYQEYLLSSTYPDGKARNISETPLNTNIAAPTPSLPYSFEQKYATLEALNLDVQFAPKPAPTQQAAPTATTTTPSTVVAGIDFNNTTENTIKINDELGDVKFTAKLDESGKPEITATSTEQIINVAKNPAAVKKYIDALRGIKMLDEAKSPEEQLMDFVSLNIAAQVTNKIKQAAPAPQVTKAEEKKEEPKPEAPKEDGATDGPSDNDLDLRAVAPGEEGGMTDEELQLFKEWHANNVPLIPYEIVENVLTTHNGVKAWGAFENGVAKFVRGGLRGTEYHEIFEGIWKMLPKEQQDAIISELRESGKDFTDRETRKTLNYATATEKQIKERIADDFSDYRLGKLPARTLGEKIRRFFKAIMDFFKSFVVKPSLKEQLFKAIDTGKFKNTPVPERVKNEAAEYRRVGQMSEKETHEFLQDMVARASRLVYKNAKEDLFVPGKVTSGEVFSTIKESYATERYKGIPKIDYIGEANWPEIVKRAKESLRPLGINFNEGDVADINSVNSNNRDYAPEPFSVDWKKNSPGPLKFTIATLIQQKALNQEGKLTIELPKPDISSVGGYKLMNSSRVFATLLDRLSNTSSFTKFTEKLLALGKSDSSYIQLYQKLGGKISSETMDLDKFSNADWRLLIQAVQTFTKQKPEALVQYIKENETFIAPANIYTATNELKRQWMDNMKTISKKPVKVIPSNLQGSDRLRWVLENDYKLIRFDSDAKVYKVDTATLKLFPIKEAKDMITMLDKIGIEFPIDVYTSLKTREKNEFAKAVSSIISYFGKEQDVMKFTKETVGINGPLSTLAELVVKTTNPNIENTYFNLEGERVNNYTNNNYPSVFENEFNEVSSLNELLALRPELKDVFSGNSQILKKGGRFFDEDGNRTDVQVKIRYIQGTDNNGKGITTSKLGLGARSTQEINQNVNGNYYVLIPADGSTEWMINLGNTIEFQDFDANRAWSTIYDVFNGYLMDDINLALDAKNRQKIRNIGSKASELRFFKDILSEKVLSGLNNLIASEETTLAQINDYLSTKEIKEDVNDSIRAYIEETAEESESLLKKNGQILQYDENKFSFPELEDNFASKNGIDKNKMSQEDITKTLTFLNTNYIINNIEMHKVLFGDPYQFEVKSKNGKIVLDETKRIKSFLSPAITMFDHPAYNNFLDDEYNKVGDVTLKEGDPGYHSHKPYTNTVTFADDKIVGSLANVMAAYGDVNVADAASWLMDTTHREIMLKNGKWGDDAEAFHQWQMAYTRRALAKKGVWSYEKNPGLEKLDNQLLSKRAPKYTLAVVKPIVRGVKYNSSFIDLDLDKTSQMPIYYSMVERTNLEKVYVQMFNSGKGYAIVQSGRKVGAEGLHSIYNGDGSINEQPFNNNIQIPWKAYSIQVETGFEYSKDQTLGSQLAKLSSLDLFDNGEASEEAKKQYERNTRILREMTLNGYRELLNKLGIVDNGFGFSMPNGKAVSEVLVAEMLRRTMSDNAIDTIQLDENDQFRIPFEASPSYVQIRDVMYSLIDKNIGSPKVNGGSYVQVPVTGFEDSKKGRGLVRKIDGKWTKITKQQYNELSEDQKKGVALTDDSLKFYEDKDGRRYCEVMLPAWFKNTTLVRKLENGVKLTAEEESILTGIGFRIPTQAMSSVEVFKVKGFLPDYMGYTVVVPAEITTKAGSDFDIDKLNMYLKATYVDELGNLRLVKYMDSEEATKDFYAKVFDKKLERKKINKAELFEAAQIISNNLDDPKGLVDRYSDLIDDLMEDFQGENNVTDFEDYLMGEMEKLGDEQLQATLKDKFVKRMYKKSLENEYYDSLEKMITLPENFQRLISPVSDAGLPKVADRLDELTGYDESKIKNRILNRTYMTSLRHAFLLGKKWIGIAAVNITGHSLFQKSKIYINPAMLEKLSAEDQKFLGDCSVILDHNTVKIDGVDRISMSGTKTADGTEYISDRLSGYATSFVDVAKDPYILKIIKSDLIVGTFMFLERIGAGKQAALFLNQPIISEYLRMLDATGGKSLFTKANIALIKSKFVTTNDLLESAKMDVSKDNLEKNISLFASDNMLSKERSAEQLLIFDEFLKYAKMAEQSYNFSQAINYDTTKFRSGDALARKQWRTQLVRNANIISSVDDVLRSSFLGNLERALSFSMEAMGTMFKLETSQMRMLVEDILRPYGENKYVSNDDFEKLAVKTKSALLDYIIETKTDLGRRLKELLVNSETSVADRLLALKTKYPNLQILKDLAIDTSERPDGAKTVKLNANTKDAYDENLYAGYMRELRDFNDETNAFYNDLVLLSLSQGTYQSPVTFKNIVPIEDFSRVIVPAVSALVNDESMAAFTDSFAKNNFKDDTVMPSITPKFFATSDEPVAVQLTSFGDIYADIYQYISSMFPNVEAFQIKSSERKIMLLNKKYNEYYMGNNYLKVPRVITDRTTGESIDMVTGRTITKMDYAKMKAKGDLSLTDVFGYKRVNLPSGDPLVTYDKDGNEIYVYKLTNLLGDGYRAVEHYTDERPSVFQNGTIQIKDVIPDSNIIEYYGGKINKKDLPSQQTPTLRVDIPMSQENIAKLESGEKTMTLRTQKESDLINIPVGVANKRLIGGKPYAVRNRGYLTVQEAGGKEAVLKAEAVKDESELQYDYTRDFVNGKIRLYVYDIKPLPVEEAQQFRLSILEDKIKTKGLSPAEVKELADLRKQAPVQPSTPEIVTEAPKTGEISPEVIYKDKEKRIRIEYPNEIKVEETGDTFKTSKLLEIKKAFTAEDDGTIADQRKFDEEYEEWLSGYGMTDTQYQYALKNQEVLRDLLYIADNELLDNEGDTLEFNTFEDVINELLKRNERLVDTAQLSLFDPNNDDLEGADEPNPCGQ